MSDKKRKFHQIALQSSLFKGRSDWYFCFLKSERIAHVLALLADHAPDSAQEVLLELVHDGSELPRSIAHMAAGEYEVRQVLGDIFSLISSVRILATRKVLTQDTARILLEEYETLAERMDEGERVSPFVTSDDFNIPLLSPEPEEIHNTPTVASRLPALAKVVEPRPEKPKGQDKMGDKGHAERSQIILNFVLQSKGVSIKDISSVVKDCSEKTIQRELTELIKQGRIQKVGERRWSLYMPMQDER